MVFHNYELFLVTNLIQMILLLVVIAIILSARYRLLLPGDCAEITRQL